MGFFDFLTEEIAIDLGTANTLIIHNDKVVVDSPSIVALDRNTKTLRSATMKSNTRMEAKQTKAGFEIYIVKQYKLYDEFKEPYNIKVIDGYIKIYALTKKETGTPYKMSSGYRDQYIIKKTFSNRQEALKYLEEQIK